jgi:regulator of cell morphogenesis and NO signaling
MTITASTTVGDIATTLPSSVQVLQRYGVDFCCGGKRPLGDVCAEQGLSLPELTAAIEASALAPDGERRDWRHEPLHRLIAHIVTTYHDRLREDLPRLEAMAAKAAKAHTAKAPYFSRLGDVIGELSADLNDHMHKEECVLFPAIVALENGARHHAAWIHQPIAAMEQEHDRAGELLAELRRVTHQYAIPDWGCATVRALHQGLEALEASMHVHVHLENNVLFPRAIALAEGVGAATPR